MLVINILFVCYLVGLAVYHQLYKYALIALFCAFSSGFYYICDTLFEHLADHQRIRIEVLLGTKDDPRGAGYNVNQAKHLERYGKDAWIYKSDKDGKFHWSQGYVSRPFMYNTLRWLEEAAPERMSEMLSQM